MEWVKRPVLKGREPPGVPQPIQELLGRRSLGGGILELSAEAQTPATAIRRKIAKRTHFHSRRISNTGWQFFSPSRSGRIGSDQAG